jgi:antitoxin (DNA-binding transcriptional repressor) of toxin-antitoxin stability system
MKQVPVADLERDLDHVLEAAERGESTVVLRGGKPVAVISPWGAGSEAAGLPSRRRPGGLLAIAGLLADWETIDADMAEIVDARQRTVDRPGPDLD